MQDVPSSIRPSSSLVSFIRAEFKPNPAPVEGVFCRHVRNCKQREACLLPGCLDMRRKLAHLDVCTNVSCMPCSSARIAALTCQGLLPQELIERYLREQTDLMQKSMQMRKLARNLALDAPNRTELLTALQQAVQLQRACFAKVQAEVYEVWTTRPRVSPGTTSFLGKNHVIGNWLKHSPANAQVLHDWEHTREAENACKLMRGGVVD